MHYDKCKKKKIGSGKKVQTLDDMFQRRPATDSDEEEDLSFADVVISEK